MWSTDDDDQDFTGGGASSKLGSLFGMGQPVAGSTNTSLKYTAPKEPKKKKADTTQGSANPGLMNAVAVHAYKYVDGAFASQGRVGSAIVANHDACDYKIILYVSKQQPMGTVKITPQFILTIQDNRYASFYDDARQSWSVLFDTDQQQAEFAKQVALAKGLSASAGGGRLDQLITQDMELGEGGELESGDSAEMRYTGWLLDKQGLGEEFDSNVNAEKLFRFKLGKGKVIRGWEEGVLGMKKGSRRQLVVPPEYAYGQKGQPPKVPVNATLIFDIEVVRVKLTKSHDSANNVPAPTVGDSESDTDSIKLKLQDEPKEATPAAPAPKTDKARLISRIAKMGQAMLPVAPLDADEAGDKAAEEHTEQTEPTEQHREQPPSLSAPSTQQPQQVPSAQPAPSQPAGFIPAPGQQYYNPVSMAGAAPYGMGAAQSAPQPFFHNGMQGMPAASSVAMYQSPMQMQPYQSGYGPPQPPGYNQMYGQQQPPPPAPTPAPAPAPASSANMDVIASETRQQNTEVRLSLSKVSDKVDRMYEKLDYLSSQQSNQLAIGGNLPNMETGVLLHNIQRVIQENERLKKDVFEKSTRIESQNEKIADLLQRNQKFVEQSNTLLEQRNDTFKTTAAQSQVKVLTLEQEKVAMATQLSATTAQLGSLQLEISSLKKTETELRQQLSSVLTSDQAHKEQLTQVKIRHSENETTLEQLTGQLKDEKQLRKNYETQLTTLREEIADLKNAHDILDKALTKKKKVPTATLR